MRSFYSAFFSAGLPEEAAKLIMIVITLVVFRSKVKNVYEYCLIGNRFLSSTDEALQTIGLAIAAACTLIMFIAQFIVLSKLKKNAAKYSGMKVI